MGRKTFAPFASGMGGKGGPFAGMRIVVVSSTLEQRDHPGVTLLRDDLEASLGALKREEGKDIWLFGGGGLFRSLLGMGLVDTVEVAVIPVLLGAGSPAVAPSGQSGRVDAHGPPGLQQDRHGLARVRGGSEAAPGDLNDPTER